MQIALVSSMCSPHLDWTWTSSYGRDFSDQVGERSEGQLCAPLKWFNGGGGKFAAGAAGFCPMWVTMFLSKYGRDWFVVRGFLSKSWSTSYKET